MKPEGIYVNIDEALFQDVVTGKYYVMTKERARELSGIINKYGGRNQVPEQKRSE